MSETLQIFYEAIISYLPAMGSIALTVIVKIIVDKLATKANISLDTVSKANENILRELKSMKLEMENLQQENRELRNQVNKAVYKLRNRKE